MHDNQPIRIIQVFILVSLISWIPSVCLADSEPKTGDSAGWPAKDTPVTGNEIPILNISENTTVSDDILVKPMAVSSAEQHWKPGITPLSNLTPEQKKKVRSLKHNPVNTEIRSATLPISVPEDLPESFDWRDNDGDWTTPVKDQGEDCGSCWAHAATGVLESYWKISQNDPSLTLDLSEQYLVSCDTDDDGCDGGDFATAMPYLVSTPGPDGLVGTVKEENYPYTEDQGECPDLTGIPRYKAEKWAYVNATAEEDPEPALPSVDELKAAIYRKGPIAVGVQDDDDFDDYSGGIFYSDATYQETNHAVILVGWGSEDGEEYFIGKNSAGTEWGEDGWFRIDTHSNRIGEGAVYLE